MLVQIKNRMRVKGSKIAISRLPPVSTVGGHIGEYVVGEMVQEERL